MEIRQTQLLFQTLHFKVGQYACESSHNMESVMWQTICKLDFLHSSHKRFPTTLSCGIPCTTSQIGSISGSWLYWWSWKLKKRPRWNSLYIWEWNIRSHKLDVQETNFSLTQFYPIWSDIVRCKSTWTEFPLLICGIILQFNPEHGATCCVINTQKHSNERTKKESDTSKDLGWTDVDYVTSSAKTFSLRCFGLNILEDIEATMKMIIKGGSRTTWHVSELTELRLTNTLKVSTWTKTIQSNRVDTKNQHANILPKRSFSRNEWNHLLCLFKISNLSMYSCSHISDFLSDEHRRKQSAMTKRSQKTTSNEGSPTAKATPCLVLGEQKNEDTSSRSLGSLFNPENTDERTEVKIAAGNSWRSVSRSEIEYAQANRQENVPMAAGNSMRWWENTFLLQQHKETCCVNTRIEKHGTHERRNILNANIQNKCIDMENVQCPRRWKPTSILGRISSRIRKSTRTQNSMKLNIVSTLLRSW